jgi:predicted neuraminidase
MKDTDNLIQPTIIRLNNSANCEHSFVTKALNGLSWTAPISTSLPNNNAGIEAYTLRSGAIIMAFNNHNDKHKSRAPLTIVLFCDNGMTWPYHRDVQIHDDDDSTYIGEYS